MKVLVLAWLPLTTLAAHGAAAAPPPAQDPESLLSQIIPWAIVLIALLLIAFFGLSWIRRRLGGSETESQGVGFTLQDLRRMHEEGELSDNEFERAKSQMIKAVDPAAAGHQDSDEA